MLDAGDAFGEVALLDQAPRSASVEAVGDCVLIKITAGSFQKLMTEHPALASQFLYHLARSLERQLSDLTTKLRRQLEQTDMTPFL